MNKTEYLLSCLAEEASKLVTAIEKAKRCGLSNGTLCEKGFTTNEDEIKINFIGLLSVFTLLEEAEVIKLIDASEHPNIVLEKINELKNQIEFSQKAGTLKEDINWISTKKRLPKLVKTLSSTTACSEEVIILVKNKLLTGINLYKDSHGVCFMAKNGDVFLVEEVSLWMYVEE